MMLVHFGSRLEGATKAGGGLPLAPAALPGTDPTFDRMAVATNSQGELLVKGLARSTPRPRRRSGQLKPKPAGRGSRRWVRAPRPILNCRRWSFCGLIERRPMGQSVLAEAQDKGFGIQPGRAAEPNEMSIGPGMETGPGVSAADMRPVAFCRWRSPRRRAGAIVPGRPTKLLSRLPMLDMAFQLLAFFIITFKPPSAETQPRPGPSSHTGGPPVRIARRRPAHTGPERPTPTWKTTCSSVPRPMTWATSKS